MSRRLICAVAALAALAVAPSAQGASWTSAPFALGEHGTAVFGLHGATLAISYNGLEGYPYNRGTLSVYSAKRRAVVYTARKVTLLRTVSVKDGSADLLIRSPGDGFPATRGRILVVRVSAKGIARTRLSVGVPEQGTAEIVRGTDGRTVVMVTDLDHASLVVAAPGRPFGARRALRGLGNGLERPALAVDARGRVVVAVRRLGGLLEATLSPSGKRLWHRQIRDLEFDRVQLAASRNGRIALVTYDTGVEGGFGECAADGGGRSVSVALREPGALRFGALRLLERPAYDCRAVPARVVAGDDGRIAVLWGTLQRDAPPPQLPGIRLSVALPGSPFSEPATAFAGRNLSSALFDASGALLIAGVASRNAEQWGLGPLVVQAVGAAAPELTSTSDADGSLLLDPRGRVLLVWHDGAQHLLGVRR